MKKHLSFCFLVLVSFGVFAQSNDNYETSVTFPADYQVGDYVEFVKTAPIDAATSGFYEISISYTRGNIAAAATHIAAVTHASQDIWRETGRVNANDYVNYGIRNFTIDCNSAIAKFRIRAVATHGIATPITVHIKIRSINFNSNWYTIDVKGNNASAISLHAMTNEWSLYTGHLHSSASAEIALHANSSGYVGVGTKNPTERLSVKGKIRAQEIKVEADNGTNWPDYVFKKDYPLPSLAEVEKHIKEKGHLPEVPSAKEVEKEGIALGANQAVLLKKIEELTLYIIEQQKKIELLEQRMNKSDRSLNK
ncbi:hypothetical protein ACTJIJ_22420 [Niabella sp. 22666]|uniref:hypothetical protein n=1 Tax=Niabella sp. 22666 TaxID=3453954 RepID=UPI003F86FD5C